MLKASRPTRPSCETPAWLHITDGRRGSEPSWNPPAKAFYPDANGCLRLSAGHVEGYSAADAVQHTPVTTLGGL